MTDQTEHHAYSADNEYQGVYIATHEQLMDAGLRSGDAPPPDLEAIKANLIAGIKAEAERRILSIFPEFQQRNALARMHDLQAAVNPTADEQAELSEHAARWATVTAIRAASNELEAMAEIPLSITWGMSGLCNIASVRF